MKAVAKFAIGAALLVLASYFLYDAYQSGYIQSYVGNTVRGIRHQLGPEPPPKPGTAIGALEIEVFERINEQRAANGLAQLGWNSELAAAAREHSKFLANMNPGFTTNIYISHTGVNGTMHTERLNNASVYYYSASAENIHGTSIVKTYYLNDEKTPASYYTQNELAANAVEGWMNSPGHRKNILTPDFDETGVGIATDETGTNYVMTQLFITRAECGYLEGPCCTKPGYYPYCFIPLKCARGVCSD